MRDGDWMNIRLADQKDFELLEKYELYPRREILIKKIQDRYVYIIEENANIVGWLRYGLFWDVIPFMNMLFILEDNRGKGYGKALALEWEKDMKSQGHKIIMTSTQANEYSQHFYRKLGYKDVGSFLPPNSPLELILTKEI